MNNLSIYCHPNPERFNHAADDSYRTGTYPMGRYNHTCSSCIVDGYAWNIKKLFR